MAISVVASNGIDSSVVGSNVIGSSVVGSSHSGSIVIGSSVVVSSKWQLVLLPVMLLIV